VSTVYTNWLTRKINFVFIVSASNTCSILNYSSNTDDFKPNKKDNSVFGYRTSSNLVRMMSRLLVSKTVACYFCWLQDGQPPGEPDCDLLFLLAPGWPASL
jgi:hypothetical protein